MEKQQKEEIKQRNAADLLVECLQEEGVEYIFGIPGEENLAVMNAIDRSPIKFITTRHEQGAAFMADVYGRLTGKAGVCGKPADVAKLQDQLTGALVGLARAVCHEAYLCVHEGHENFVHYLLCQCFAKKGYYSYGVERCRYVANYL